MRFLFLFFLLVGAVHGQQPVPESQRAWPGPNSSHAIFSEYRTRGFAKWKPHWTYRYDLTGVSMELPMAATLITKRHVVMAKHYPRKVGDRIHFHDRRGKAVARTLIKIADTKYDVSVGLLGKAVPRSLCVYPLPELENGDFEKLVGRRVLVTDKTRHLHVHEFDNVIGGSYVRLRSGKGFKAKKLIGGDSGNPSFIVVRGGLVLVETHTHGGAGAGPFYGSSEVQQEIRRAMKELGVNLPLELVKVSF